ncbi:hypothetical protein BC940DRAFT_329112 [Gongronella butleri]|nr:hypothetical protein BC940DRAFT_329112 [Gongronella butleri]
MSSSSIVCHEIIREEFGDLTSMVALQLMKRRFSSLDELERATLLTRQQVRKALVVLIQHQLCLFTEPVQNLATDDPPYYLIDETKVLLRLRMARFMEVAQELFGDEGRKVAQAVYTFGCLSVDEMHKQTLDILACFNMIEEGFLTRVWPDHSRWGLENVGDASVRKNDTYKITPMVVPGTPSTATAAAEQQIDAAASNRPPDVFSKELATSVMLYALNYKKFNLHLRNKMMMDFVTDELNDSSGDIIAALFEHAKKHMADPTENDTLPASLAQLAVLVPEDLARRSDLVLESATSESGFEQKGGLYATLRRYLVLLRSAGIVNMVDRAAGAQTYAVNVLHVRNRMRQRMLEEMVAGRFGAGTARLLRILLARDILPDKELHRIALLPLTETRTRLWELAKAGYIDTELLGGHDDRAPVYLSTDERVWHLDTEHAYAQLLVDVYTTIMRLQMRRQHERDACTNLLAKQDRDDVRENQDLLDDKDKANLDALDAKEERIDVAIERLDSMILLLRDICQPALH